jgi:hypothetical protein
MRGVRTKIALLGFLVTAGLWLARVSIARTGDAKEQQARFDAEENSVHKAKLMNKLGDAQFGALHEAEKVENYNLAAEILEKYRDNVRAALAALRKQHPDAERQSNGYRQLEMHLGRGIHEVNDALHAAPLELLPPLRLVREDLIAMDDEMLRLLFPKRTSDAKPKAKSAPQPPETKPDEKPDKTLGKTPDKTPDETIDAKPPAMSTPS